MSTVYDFNNFSSYNNLNEIAVSWSSIIHRYYVHQVKYMQRNNPNHSPRKMYSLGTPVFSSASLKACVHGLVSSFRDVSMDVRTSSILLAIFSAGDR